MDEGEKGREIDTRTQEELQRDIENARERIAETRANILREFGIEPEEPGDRPSKQR